MPMFGLEFRDKTFKLNMTYDETIWTQVKPEKYRDRLVLRHLNSPATINVLAYRFNETITANGLVQRRIQSVYDGWQLINQTDLTDLQAKQKNITKGIRSIYRKTYLDNALAQQHMIAGDICLVTDDTLGIVINISVDDPDTLLDIKPEFNKFYSSFWFGDTKPTVNSVVNNSNEWIMDQQNLSRKRFFNTDFKLNNKTNITRKIKILESFDTRRIKTYTNNNGDYILNDQIVHFIHPVTNESTSFNLPLRTPELILAKDGFFAVQKEPRLAIIKYSNTFEPLFEYKSKQLATHVFPINKNLLIIEPDTIKIISKNELVWELNHKFNIHHVVADKDQLIIADNRNLTLRVVNLNEGTLIQSIPISKESDRQTFLDLSVNQSKILAVSSHGSTITHTIIDLKTKDIEDSMSKKYDSFDIAGITNELIIIKYKNDENATLLEALDFNTFASVWVVPFNNQRYTTVSSHHILSINDNDQLESLELKTAKKASPIYITSLINPLAPTDNVNDINVLGLMPAKNNLMAIVKEKSANNIFYFR